MAKPPFVMSKYMSELDLYKDKAAYYQALSEKICTWTVYDYEHKVDTECGEKLTLTKDQRDWSVSKGFQYCPYCGGKIEVL